MTTNKTFLALAFLAVTAIAIGCKQSTEQPSKTASDQMADVKQETKEAAQDMKEYSYAEKTEFVAKMQAQLATINGGLDELSAKIDKANDAAKAEAKPKLEALRKQADGLSKQLDTVKASTESTWGDVKAAFKKGWGDFNDGLTKTRQWVSDKIAP